MPYKPNTILETQRLYLRELTPDDAEQAYLLNLDPDVIKYTGDKAFDSVESTNLFLHNYDHYHKYGFGRWAVIQKTDDVILGWCGLKYTPGLVEYDIGFRFFKKYWNMGFATESAKACMELGFTKYNLKTIAGRAMKENTASIKVLKKIGMKFTECIKINGQEMYIYIIENKMSYR